MKVFFFLSFLTGVAFSQEITYRDVSKLKITTSYEMKKALPEKVPVYTNSDIKYDSNSKLHLSLEVVIVSLEEEDHKVKLKDQKNNTLFVKKSKIGNRVSIDFGDIELAKDRKSNYKFDLLFFNKENRIINKVEFQIMESGALFVNNEPLKN